MDKIQELASAKIAKNNIGQFVYELKTSAEDSRRSFARRWYDNNFFDDGFHFRYLSRQQNKIIDLSDRSNIYAPVRAIPKASRQIRGVANLLVSQKYIPVVYPMKISPNNFAGGMQDPLFMEAQRLSKDIAKRSGNWIENQFKEQDMNEKMAFMAILTAKHGVSYMQIWPDDVREKIRTQVFDAFDIYLMGNLTEIYDSPFIGKSIPRLVSEIQADEHFDYEQVRKINPDNKLASSDIKQAYASVRFGRDNNTDTSVTVIQNEFFIKEYLGEQNRFRISMQKNGDEILLGKKDGDMVMRHVFTAGNVWLSDEYINLPEYPFVDYRMEPGPIYQVPLIERFIPANKSLDMAVSRLERFFHTMNTGAWLKRQGEQVNFTNQSGGQVIEYSTTPPVQATIASPSGMSFPFLGFLSSLIEEQGVTTSTLGKIPAGVKANAAIESLKESEYAALLIASERMKGTQKRIAEKFLDIADKHFVTPQEVKIIHKGEPNYFDVIGATAFRKRQELGVADDIPSNTVPLSAEYGVDIEVEQGLAFTSEGKKVKAKEFIDSLLPYFQGGLIPSQAFKSMLEAYLETWQFGSISDIMEAVSNAPSPDSISDDVVQKVKIAVLEALKDAGEVGKEASDKRITENKIGVMEALKDSGILDRQEQPTVKPPSESISFKDLPPEGQAQMAAQAGIQLDAEELEERQEKDKALEMAAKVFSNKGQQLKGGTKNATTRRKVRKSNK